MRPAAARGSVQAETLGSGWAGVAGEQPMGGEGGQNAVGQNPRQSHWGGLERTAVDPEAKMFKAGEEDQRFAGDTSKEGWRQVESWT